MLINENLNLIFKKESQIMIIDLKNIVNDVLLKFDNTISIDQKEFLKKIKRRFLNCY